jgi:hypothetical protein
MCMKDIAKALKEDLHSAIDQHNEGLICDKEFINNTLLAAHRRADEAVGHVCKGFDPSNAIFAGCRDLACGTRTAESKPAKFTFKLQFDANTKDEEVSRMLDVVTDHCILYAQFAEANDPETVSAGIADLLFEIQSAVYYIGGGMPNRIIKTMLSTLAVTNDTFIAYCFECDKIVTSKCTTETVCAYDTVGHGDSHKVFKITINESDDDRLFARFWGNGYGTWPTSSTPPSDTVGVEQLTENEGYDEVMQSDINKLQVGEAWTDHTHGPHSVVRVK